MNKDKDRESVFWHDYLIHYDLEDGLRASACQMLFWLQETALLHGVSASYPLEWFLENRKGWVITRWQCEMYKYPKWGDTVRVNTWCSRFKGILGERSFSVSPPEGGPAYMYANSVWIFTDLARHMPIKPPERLVSGYGGLYPPAGIRPVAGAGRGALISETAAGVTGRDLDMNAHMNNLRYIDKALGAVPGGAAGIRRLEAGYKKQCLLGEKLKIRLYAEEAGCERIYTALIVKETGEEAAEIRAAVPLGA